MSTAKLHPLLATAAVAVTATSVLAAVALVRDQVFARHAAAPAQAVAQLTDAAVPPATPVPPVQTPAAAAPASAPQSNATRTPAATSPAAPRSATAPRPANPAPRVAPVAPVAAPVAAEPLPPVARAPMPVIAAPVCVDCGVVTAVREVKVAGAAQGLGAVGGAVVGGVIGNQIGKGSGRDAARILGIVGGAVAGHQVEKQARSTLRYDVDVRMDDGSLRTVSMTEPPAVRSGDSVRVDGRRLIPADGRALPRPAPLGRETPAMRQVVDAGGA